MKFVCSWSRPGQHIIALNVYCSQSDEFGIWMKFAVYYGYCSINCFQKQFLLFVAASKIGL